MTSATNLVYYPSRSPQCSQDNGIDHISPDALEVRMEDIARFLHEHPPFSLLPFDQVRRVTELIQIEYFPSGHNILVQDGPRFWT